MAEDTQPKDGQPEKEPGEKPGSAPVEPKSVVITIPPATIGAKGN